MSVSHEGVIKQVDDYKEQVKKQGECIVREGFPSRIIELNRLLEQAPFASTDLSQFHSPLNIPVPPPGDAGDAAPCSTSKVATNNIAASPNTATTTTISSSADSETPASAAKRRRVSSSGASEAAVAPLAANVAPAAAAGSMVYALTSGVAPCNQAISDIVQILKPILRRLMDECNLLKMWITYLIPKIEDGNNFGVSIQEDTLGEVSVTESEVATYFYELSRYYSVRARLVAKVAKYPHLEDYRRAVDELDEKQFVQLRLTLIEIRNRYSTLQDVINKNIEKIKTPRTANDVHSIY